MHSFNQETIAMLLSVIPKLPMRDPALTRDYYSRLGFRVTGDYGDYLLMEMEGAEIHFFLFRDLNPGENYGQVYLRTNAVHDLYQAYLQNGIAIHPNGGLSAKPWGMEEFSLLDPDHNLLTFGQEIPGQ